MSEPALEIVRPGFRTNAEGQPVRSRILLGLPSEEFNPLRPLLMFQPLSQHASLYEPGVKMEFVYFLNCGLVSILVVTSQGKTVEIGVVGNEGMVGMPALAGVSASPHRAVVQIAGDGFRVRLDAMQNVLPFSLYLQKVLIRYVGAQWMQATQAVACNRLHGVEQRFARWLLIVTERSGQDSLHITHEFLATMLGTDRPSVSLAAGMLQKKGAIEYTRGALRIANRGRLEEATCECYSVMQQFDADLGFG